MNAGDENSQVMQHRICLHIAAQDGDASATRDDNCGDSQHTIPLILQYSLNHVEIDSLEYTTGDFLGEISPLNISARDDELDDGNEVNELVDIDDDEDDEDENEEGDPLTIFPHNGDSVLLKCCQQQPSGAIPSSRSIWGGSQNSYCRLNIYQPSILFNETNHSMNSVLPNCTCMHPRGNWSRAHLASSPSSNQAFGSSDYSERLSQPLNHETDSVCIIDLASLQLLRRQMTPRSSDATLHDSPMGMNTRTTISSLSNISSLHGLRMNSPAAVLHILRSSFYCHSSSFSCDSLHITSPWKQAYRKFNSYDTKCSLKDTPPTTFCMVLLYSSSSKLMKHNVINGGGSTKDFNSSFSDNVLHDSTDLSASSSLNQDGVNRESDKSAESWTTLEQEELKSFVDFRTGDAVPSYFLYSVSRLLADNTDNTTFLFWKQFISNLKEARDEHHTTLNTNLTITSNQNVGRKSDNTLELAFLIYKPLPPRLHMLTSNPDVYIKEKTEEEQAHATDFCFWEKMTHASNSDSNFKAHEDSSLIKSSKIMPDASTTDISYRRVAPPYQDHFDLYPSAFNVILENLEQIRKEALSIPLWTAWPERNHYETTTKPSSDKVLNDDVSIKNSTAGASWTVFPLCHTFPATDLSSRKWIPNTCKHVPFTCTLLRDDPILSPLVRTALFSRLEPGTILSPHTGWADLANYVLRVHIPLVVPSGGLCGLWVDGCVETHDVGRIVSFDDSKVHRAFNYSDEDRIVLIVDLVRPIAELKSSHEAARLGENGSNYPTFPLGTSVGGHTDELDAFIRQFE